MKVLTQLARIIVGLLFIFSGLVKANDPLGLSYKMQEFFEIWGWSGLHDYTLLSSILMNAFEIIAGFALLLGWRIRLFTWLLLLLIVFFTFLTGYTYITGKPANCGCFGDCLPITSFTSFMKDVILTVLIMFLCWQQRHIRPLFGPRLNTGLMLLVTLFSFGLQWYALTYLPPVDCLPFKKGNNIPEKMQPPPGAVPDSFAIRFIYEKEGKEYEFSPAELPADLDAYTFKSRKDRLIRAGNAIPPIKGFRLSAAGDADATQEVLISSAALVLFCENFETVPFKKWSSTFGQIVDQANKKNIPVYVVTSNRDAINQEFAGSTFAGLPVLTADAILIHTAARTNPCLFLLESGTIVDKQGYRRMDQILKQVENMPALNTPATQDR